MSYAMSSALQASVYNALISDVGVNDLVAGAIYDALPTGVLPSLYLTLGPEKVVDLSDQTGHGARHEFTISIVSQSAGFASAKNVAGAVCDALVDADLPLSRGRLIALNFRSAKAARIDSGSARQIILTFRAFVEDN
ncbi:hypothetical protein BVC71_04215 [Marivivens niveibacter]|uniref:DUF3168 domain-containing protein n=1 Tax=Marivivens niveibacter TaxID=1930667 RepID=A0A251X1Y1_9RHOB|nr:DUF3168 domain-containing protein [Marivivens niveibacter]OUD10697.1 hypothetical protein BVC71_04215 [Marivivens niveibacter]